MIHYFKTRAWFLGHISDAIRSRRSFCDAYCSSVGKGVLILSESSMRIAGRGAINLGATDKAP